jgi:ribonuclease PH
MIEVGHTKIYCTVSIEDKVPHFISGKGEGWLTSEYSLLPRSTHTRGKRERMKVGGRTQEIQRLIGRSLRSIIDFKALGEKTLLVDCDVLQADGGTRCASITGSYVALSLAVERLMKEGSIKKNPILTHAAAVSAGVVPVKEGMEKHACMLDLAYEEDSQAEVDLNVVGTADGDIIEVQGTAEGMAFQRAKLDQMLDLGQKGLSQLIEAQKEAVNRGIESMPPRAKGTR